MNDTTRILVVDDHALVRGTLCEHLKREARFEVVGSASTADEAIAKATECNPDIILMDIDMPGMNCFNTAKTILSLRPDVRIIFLSAFTHDKYIDQALEAKARGYLTKREPVEAVVAAVREVASGGAYFSPEVRERIVVDERGAKLTGTSKSRAASLTPRETEILQYVARGLSKKEIAATAHLSVKTVDRHCANLMQKLNIHDRVELARFAIREGLADA